MESFRDAVERRDPQGVSSLLADEVLFRSPIVFSEYCGREAVGTILRAVAAVLEDVRYVRSIGAPDARDQALVFNANLAGLEVEGCDFIHLDEQGLIAELSVMVRPLSAALALADAMREKMGAVTP